MALPTILVNSATGSDTQASGAGPSTALFGTTDASTDGAGTTVTLTAGTDLTNVATDGSHVIFLNDTTAGARNFGKITGKAGSGGATPTVTVANAFGLSLTNKSWAIGGKRASIASTTSKKLFDNNSGNGDALPGWIIEMESGHTETIAASFDIRRAGDTTNGYIILRGTLGAGTLPLLTFSNNGNCILPRASYWLFEGFELQNSNATKTASIAFVPVGSPNIVMRNIRCNHATNKFWKYISDAGGTSQLLIESCDLRNFASVGITLLSAAGFIFRNSIMLSCGSHGISLISMSNMEIEGSIIAYNTTDGINITSTTTAISQSRITGNIFHGNGGDGIEVTSTSTQLGWFTQTCIQNNQFTFNSGYGINLSGASISDILLNAVDFKVRNNGFYNNSFGKYNGITVASSISEVTTDPSSGNASSTKDYAGTTNGLNFMSSVHKGLGFPIGGTLSVGNQGTSYNYQDIGLQHQDSGGSAGIMGYSGMDGGFNG